MIPVQREFNPRTWNPATDVSKPVTVTSGEKRLSWDVYIKHISQGIRFSATDDATTSMLTITFILNRNPFSYSLYFIFSSCIFILLSYCTYYISKFAVTARVLLAINVVLLTIQFNSYVHQYLPPSEKSTWLEEYLRGVLIFACITMLEFVFLNFVTC